MVPIYKKGVFLFMVPYEPTYLVMMVAALPSRSRQCASKLCGYKVNNNF